MSSRRLPKLVHRLLQASAEEDGERVLLIDGSDQHTYGEMDTRSSQVAGLLRSEGIRAGDRVALLAPNSHFYVASYYGILKAGAVAVPINTAADAQGVTFLLEHCSATALVLGASNERVATMALTTDPSVRVVFTEGAGRAAGRLRSAGIRTVDLIEGARNASPITDRAVDPTDLASLIYTSGSTGRPRGVMLSHANLVANTRSIIDYMALGANDRVLALLPFYYVFGKSLLNTHVAAGGSLVIENRFMYPRLAVDSLEEFECSGLPGVPSTFQILLDQTDLRFRELPALRYACQAGGPMAPSTTRRLIDALPGKQIFVMYGCTEASARLAYLPPAELANNIGKIGQPIPDVELRVLREDGVEADTGEVGELVARGPNIMMGYWNDPDATRTALDHHGLHTGDLARRDASGYFTIVGRRHDMIKSGGHRIAPQEIEDVLGDHQGVAEVAVVGVPDELLGESIIAVVVPNSMSGEVAADLPGELLALAGRRLPRYKIPGEIVVRDSLPKSHTGKVLKQPLRDEFTGSAVPMA